MAETKSKAKSGSKDLPESGVREEALPVSEADDGPEPSAREGIEDVPKDELPDETTIAQREVLKEGGDRNPQL